MHALEPQLAGRPIGQVRDERRRTGTIGDLAIDLEQAEHLLHVDQSLLDRHVHHAEKAERLIELHQVGVHQHELADGHRAAVHLARGHQHDQRQPRGDDERLADVQHIERHLHAHRGALVACQRRVVARRLVRLVAEYFTVS